MSSSRAPGTNVLGHISSINPWSCQPKDILEILLGVYEIATTDRVFMGLSSGQLNRLAHEIMGSLGL